MAQQKILRVSIHGSYDLLMKSAQSMIDDDARDRAEKAAKAEGKAKVSLTATK